MAEEKELYSRGFHHHSPSRVAGMPPPFTAAYCSEVAGMQQYTCVPQNYGAEAIYDGEHVVRFAKPNDTLRRVGDATSRGEVRYECPQGGFLSAVQRTPRIHVAPRHGYPCAPVLCPQAPTASHSPSSNLTPWMFPCPTTTPPSPYAFAPSLTCIPQTSIYPMVYPQPMFLRYMPHSVSPRIHLDDREVANGKDAPQMEVREVRLAFPPTSPTSTGNDTERPRYPLEKGTSRTRGSKPVERTTHSGRHASHVRSSYSPMDETMAHPKLNCINDRILSNFKTSKSEQFKITVHVDACGKRRTRLTQDIRGHLLPFCLDQAGSRFVQDQLAACPVQETDIVHEELAPHALTLMRDVFGNYIIQILIQNGSDEHRMNLAEIIKEHTVTLSLHVYGCRVVQKALEVLEEPHRLQVVRNLETHVARCIKDMNGNHVIQKAIRVFELDAIPFIVKAVHERALSFSVHPYGCRVVQRILERDDSSQELNIVKESIMSTIVENVGELSQDLYGNYVVQHVLHYSPAYLRGKAIETLMMAPVDYACHKYASNVLEQALLSGDKQERQDMVHAIISSPRRGDAGDALSMLTTNRFGNYVVQRMLDVVDGELKCVLVSCIGQRMKTLKKFKYGKHIVARVERMMSRPASETEEVSEGDSFCAYTVT